MRDCSRDAGHFSVLTAVVTVITVPSLIFLLVLLLRLWKQDPQLSKKRPSQKLMATLTMTIAASAPLLTVVRVLSQWAFGEGHVVWGYALFGGKSLLDLIVWFSVYILERAKLRDSFEGTTYAVPKRTVRTLDSLCVAAVALSTLWVAGMVFDLEKQLFGQLAMAACALLAVVCGMTVFGKIIYEFSKRLIELVSETETMRPKHESIEMTTPTTTTDLGSVALADNGSAVGNGSLSTETATECRNSETPPPIVKKTKSPRALALLISLKNASISGFDATTQRPLLVVAAKQSVLSVWTGVALCATCVVLVIFGALPNCSTATLFLGHALSSVSQVILSARVCLNHALFANEYSVLCALCNTWSRRLAALRVDRALAD